MRISSGVVIVLGGFKDSMRYPAYLVELVFALFWIVNSRPIPIMTKMTSCNEPIATFNILEILTMQFNGVANRYYQDRKLQALCCLYSGGEPGTLYSSH